MGVAKVIGKKGNGIDKPKPGDIVSMECAGYIYDPTRLGTGYRGKKFFTSKSLESQKFMTKIGVGAVIRGWDEGVVATDGGMSLGEVATLTISSDYAYGRYGFAQYGIPPDTGLIFDIALVAIIKRA